MNSWPTRAVCLALTLSAGATSTSLWAQPAPDGPPGIGISPASVDFGTQAVDTASVAKTVTLTNPGSAARTLNMLTAGIDFSQSNNCGESLAAGASCSVQLTFKPAIPGERIGTLTISDATGARPHLVVLTGMGQ